MDTARRIIREALATAQSPAVLCSFGKDSMLVLSLIREMNQSIPVLWFRTGQDEAFAKRIIRDWDLTAFSPAPTAVYLVRDDTMVHEYDAGGALVPLLIDLTDGTECSLQKFPRRTPELRLPFDVLFSGYKESDTHWVRGTAPLWEEAAMGGKVRIVTPIRHMTDDQVRAALAEMKVPYAQEEDSLPLCTHCMQPGPGEVYCPELGRFIPRHQWEQDASLSAFKQRFQIEEAGSNGTRI